ncbi:hypothetical protein CR513_12666, partial [Mucuna pruriens]
FHVILLLLITKCSISILDIPTQMHLLHDMLKSSFLGNKHTSSLNVVHFDYTSCKLGKSKILSFPTHHLNVTQPFDNIHSDVWGRHQLYLMSITNILLLLWMIIIVSLGWEYTSRSFKEFLQSNDIISQRSCPSTPQQNGVAEQKKIVICLMLSTPCYWSLIPFHYNSSSPSLGNKPPSLDYLVTHLISLLFVSLVVCAMSIYLHKNIPSSMNNLFNGPLEIIPWLLLQYKNLNQLLYTGVHAFVSPQKVSCPPSVKPLGSKFVFSIKLHSDGSIEYGLDYDETFAPVIKMTNVCTLLALVASQSWTLHQMDVKNPFLHGGLKEEVYIKLPYAFFIWKIGLKSMYDPSLFLQRTPEGIIVLLVYVDDTMVTSFDQKAISKLKQTLLSTFHMKELGHLTYFLGLELAGHINFTPNETPIEVNVKYRQEEGNILNDHTLYRKLVGSLIYVTITCPHISFVVHTVSKFIYLLDSSKHGLFIPTDSSINIQSYSDVD